MKIAVAGAGKIGSTLGRIWREQGHDVVLTFSRDDAALARTAAEIGGRSAPPAEAARDTEVLLLAVPAAVAAQALQALGPLDGRVLIDATNGLGAPGGPSGAQQVAALAPGARVVKAVNTVFQAMYPEAAAHPGRAAMLICGDDAAAKQTAATLMADLGFEPIDAGGLEVAADVEAFARLVIGIAYRQGRGPFAYRFAAVDQL